jgi:hypothetical protein
MKLGSHGRRVEVKEAIPIVEHNERVLRTAKCAERVALIAGLFRNWAAHYARTGAGVRVPRSRSRERQAHCQWNENHAVQSPRIAVLSE